MMPVRSDRSARMCVMWEGKGGGGRGGRQIKAVDLLSLAGRGSQKENVCPTTEGAFRCLLIVKPCMFLVLEHNAYCP